MLIKIAKNRKRKKKLCFTSAPDNHLLIHYRIKAVLCLNDCLQYLIISIFKDEFRLRQHEFSNAVMLVFSAEVPLKYKPRSRQFLPSTSEKSFFFFFFKTENVTFFLIRWSWGFSKKKKFTRVLCRPIFKRKMEFQQFQSYNIVEVFQIRKGRIWQLQPIYGSSIVFLIWSDSYNACSFCKTLALQTCSYKRTGLVEN